MRWRYFSGRFRVALLVIACSLLVAAGCSRRSYEAALVLADIAAGEGPSGLKEQTPETLLSPVSFEVEGRFYVADLYLPAEQPEAGLLLVPGAAEEGKDDPRLMAFARSLARARFAVLVPDLPSLRQLRVNPGNVQELIDLFGMLVTRAEWAPGGRAGMLAFSYAAGPALLAAMDAEVRDRVGFVFTVGAYYDLGEVLNYFTTGYYRKQGRWQFMEPNSYGKWVFVLGNLNRLPDVKDRRLFQAMFERKKADLAAPLDDLAKQLGAEGERLYAYITNTDPQRAPELMRRLPGTILEDIDSLDLANKNLSDLRARLILVHGLDDDIIPYPQSEALHRALPPGQARLYLAGGLAHVDIKPGLLSRWRLWRAVDALLAEREGRNKPKQSEAAGG